ncbi:MAG: hypothetical protein WBM84_15170, partial [Sedimenticolaceae bacterium]
ITGHRHTADGVHMVTTDIRRHVYDKGFHGSPPTRFPAEFIAVFDTGSFLVLLHQRRAYTL